MVVWGDKKQILGTGDNYESISADETLSNVIDLLSEGYYGVKIQIEVDFGDSPYHDIVLSIYPSGDGTTFADVGAKYSISNTKEVKILTEQDYPYLKIGIKQSESVNNDHLESYNARIYYRGWTEV